MCSENVKISVRRYHVFGSRTLSNYWWGIISLIGGFCFFIAGLYSYYLNFFSTFVQSQENSLVQSKSYLPEELAKLNATTSSFFNHFKSISLHNWQHLFLSFKNNLKIEAPVEIAFFPQGLSMCFYGLIGILLGTFLFFCIVFQIGCGFTEFNKEKGTVRIFRLGFPGKNRYIDYNYNLESIQSICVKISSSIVPSSQRGVYMRLKLSENQTRDIPLDLYSEKTSLEEVELQAADLSKFLRVSISIL